MGVRRERRGKRIGRQGRHYDRERGDNRRESSFTKDVPPYTIDVGTPAKEIRKRFDEKVASTLQRLKWWDWPAERIAANLPAIQIGDLMNLK